MESNNNGKHIVLYAIIGIIGFIVFFFLYPAMDDLSNINVQFTEQDVQQKIKDLSETYNVNLTGYKSTIELRRNDEVVEASQKKLGLRKTADLLQENLPAYYWHSEFNKSNQPESVTKERNIVIGGNERERTSRRRVERNIVFDISTTGQLLQFENIFPPDTTRLDSTEKITDAQAEKILFEFIPQNISGWELKESRSNRRRRGIFNHFQWITTEIEWADSLTAAMDFRGKELRRFSLSVMIDEEKEKGLTAAEIFEISTVFIILIITVFVLIGFVKRLRQDKIEFRNSWIIAILAAVSLAFIIIPDSFDDPLLNLILAVVFASPFIGVCAFVLAAVSESVSRDVWQEKLFGYDRLLKGNIHSHKLGSNLIIGFLCGGLILGLLTLFLFVYNQFGSVFFQYDGDRIKNFTFTFPFFKTIGSVLLSTIFIFFAILVFVIPYLKRFFKNNLFFILLAALIFSVIPFKVFAISPVYLRIISNFIFGLILMWLIVRFDFLSAGVALVTVLAFVRAAPYFSAGSASQIMNALLTIIFPLTFLTVGLIAVFGKNVVDDEKEYVPDYILRNRERERFQRELEIARTVQLKFLPQNIPAVKWLDIASNCIPAYEVGGDYYDFLQLSEHRFGVVVGDVSGKGVSAAFYMTLMKGIVKSQTRNVQSPKDALIQINDLFYENAQRGVFISMIYGVFDRKKQTFSFARAGHNPLISLFRQKGHAEEISPKGIAIGLDKGLLFNRSLEESTIGINPGDLFVFYTDGYTEAMDENRLEFGEEKLIEIINKNSDRKANFVLNKIQEEINRFTGKTPQHDDMTMVVVRVCESD